MRLTLFFIPVILFGAILSQIKEKELQIDKKIAIQEAKKLRDSWINPIDMRYIYQKGDQFENQKLRSFTISIDQPIFKSGGIYMAIKYAYSKKYESLFGVKLKKSELIAAAIKSGYELERIKLLIKKQELLIKNSIIDVKVKKEAYLSGEIDSTFLDSAILNKNTQQLRLLDLKEQFEQIFKNYKDLVDKSFKLPRFTLVKKEEFLNKNIEIKQGLFTKKANREFKYMTIARYLPSISLFANYNYQNSQGSLYMPSFEYKDYYNLYGLRFAMPLFDINSFKNIEIAKLNHIKSNLLLEYKKKEESNLYEMILKRVEIVKEKIFLANEDLKLYKSLLKSTKEQFKGGEKTIYDVEIMENSLKTKEIDKEIYDIDMQLLLLELYKKMELK